MHKCIVSNRSAFFRGANRGGFKESQTGVIEVEERAEVIEALLQHIYEAPLEFVARKEMSKSDLERLSTMENVQLAIELQTAADKYLINGLDADMTKTIIFSFSKIDPQDHRQLRAGLRVLLNSLGTDIRVEIYPRLFILATLTNNAQYIVADHEAWQMLNESENYARAFMKVVLETPAEALLLTIDDQEAEKLRFTYWKMAIETICSLCDVKVDEETVVVEAKLTDLINELDTYGTLQEAADA